MSLLLNAGATARLIGVSHKTFIEIRKDPAFPEPVHGKFWYVSSIKNYFDKRAGLKTDSPDHGATIRERLAQHGDGKGEISRH